MRIGGIILRIHPGTADAVASKLGTISNLQNAHRTEDGFALVIEAESPADQEVKHREIAAWPEVREASVVFQSSEV